MLMRLRRCFLPQSFIFLLSMVVLGKTMIIDAATSQLSFGAIVMQLRSVVDSDSVKIGREMKTSVSNYLNAYFNAYYKSAEPEVIDYFSHVNISAKSFGVHSVEGSFITTLEIEGSLSFNDSSDQLLPSVSFVDALLKNAFQGYNEQLFLTHLLADSTDGEEFLQKLSYMIIDVNGSKVGESRVQDGKIVNMPDHSSVIVDDAVRGISEEENSNNETGQNEFFSGKWFMIFIYSAVGFFAFSLVLFCTIFVYRQCMYQNEETEEKDDETKMPVKFINLPIKNNNDNQKHPPSDCVEKSSNRKIKSYFLRNSGGIAPSTSSTTESGRSLSDHMNRKPPSPQRSMMSQASSKFTYTDNDMPKDGTRSLGCDTYRSTKFAMDGIPSIDSAAWLGRKQDPPAFGNDISIIENNNDLSLIQECEEDANTKDIETDLGKNNRLGIDSQQQYSSSRCSRAKIDVRQSKGRLSNRSESYFYHHGKYGEEGGDSELDITSTSDVISDLKNLSLQIERCKR